MERLLLTTDQAAQALGIGRSKLYQLLRSGSIESVHIGACRRVPAAALATYIAELRPCPQHAVASLTQPADGRTLSPGPEAPFREQA